ncbi:hypothetical protein AOQ73_17870 [Bradyrhizobium pachyrhizi]|uniref:hypothetical protein n=1 Tax=Bradyrhizobium pachyrhizi TaxID=280333 RepID=UPI000704A13A|nr:hypothetical protein [Bradyrhizobium pachyrhizi]KRQ02288.1 hypothetical protein AOQ73_17870 [Bradyrhizobium pachyrhizi]
MNDAAPAGGKRARLREQGFENKAWRDQMDMGLEIIYGIGALVLLTALIFGVLSTPFSQQAHGAGRRGGRPRQIQAE